MAELSAEERERARSLARYSFGPDSGELADHELVARALLAAEAEAAALRDELWAAQRLLSRLTDYQMAGFHEHHARLSAYRSQENPHGA